MMASNFHTRDVEPDLKMRRIEEIMKTTKCFACGNEGHWFKDLEECMKAMKKNFEPRKAKYPTDGLIGSHFIHGAH